MRNLVFLVSLGLGISFCIYYFSSNTQDVPTIAQENTTENILTGSMENNLQEQNQQSLACVGTKADMSVDGDDGSSDLIQVNDIGNALPKTTPSTNRRTVLFGQFKLQKLMHQHKKENCACTMPKDDRTGKKKLIAPWWSQLVREIDKN